MSDETDNLVLTMLRAIRSDVGEIKARLTNLEHGQASLHQSLSHYATVMAQIQASIDRHGDRLDRIEQRLGMIDPAL